MIQVLSKIRNMMIKSLNAAVIVLFAALVIDVLWGVLSRFVGSLVVRLETQGYTPWSFLPHGQTRWTEEAAIFLLMWVALLGSAVAYGAKAHLGVDYFVGKLHPQAQRLAEALVHTLTAVFAAAALIWGGYVLVSETLAAGQLSPALHVKVGYVYLAVPICGVFILLFCLEAIAELIAGKSSDTFSR